jgi:Ran GTPase-activating protein (RanGAP) involved in mRNA processing and transport
MYLTLIFSAQTLTYLNLSANQIETEGAQYLSGALRQNNVNRGILYLSYVSRSIFTQTLTSLRLEDNQIGDDGIRHFSNALRDNKVRAVVF